MKKYFNIIIIATLSYILFFWFTYVNASNNDTKQKETCNWPSKTMTDYFNFQEESIGILLWSEINSKRFSVSTGLWGLFTNKVLNLPTPIDHVASNVIWEIRSFVSNTTTSVFLLILAWGSAIQSNTEWLAILFKDRPIVRDYKRTLDIETTLFDVAYFRSKSINLLSPFDSDLLEKFEKLIKKYQDLWLLEKWENIKKSENMADIITDLISMNASMKGFLLRWGGYWKKVLTNYNWCLWNVIVENCNRDVSIIKFSTDAIETLDKDYKWVRTFWSCNSNANYFKNTIKKTINNNTESVKTSIKDVKDSIKRLNWALIWSYNWDTIQSRCDMSYYEMAQLKAYRWWNRNCKDSLVSIDTSQAILKTKEYFSEKKLQREQKEKRGTKIKEKNNSNSSQENITSDIGKKINWNEMFGHTALYNPSYKQELSSDFIQNFWEILQDFWQAQENAVASDITDILPRWKWILDQVDKAIKDTDELELNLQKIEDKQCTG